MIYQLAFLFILYRGLAGSTPLVQSRQCDLVYNSLWLEVICPSGIVLGDIDISDLNSSIIESVEYLSVRSDDGSRGPLTTIPSNLCRFNNLKSLDLSWNQIQIPDFGFSIPCASALQNLSLSNNFLVHLPIIWLRQIPMLESIDLSYNNLPDLCYNAFYNVSNLRDLDVSRNSLSTIELWTIQVGVTVDYRTNQIRAFSNMNNVDLSQLQSSTLPVFEISGNPAIHFDDTIFPMYNRCAEVHNIPFHNTTYEATLTLAILAILDGPMNPQHFFTKCSCDQFYFYQTAFAARDSVGTNHFQTWRCLNDTISFVQRCNNQSSANFAGVIPRFCKIDRSEPGQVPVFSQPPAACQPFAGTSSSTTRSTTRLSTSFPTTTTTTTTTLPILPLPNEVKDQLQNISVLNNSTIKNFTSLIDNVSRNPPPANGSTVEVYQNIILLIEELITTANSTLNNTNNAVAILTTTRNEPIYQLNQFILSNSSITYSNTPDRFNSTASISINETYLDQSLAPNDLYTFFMLPSSIFQNAQTDRSIEIVSPIVGAHLPRQTKLKVEMSFIETNPARSSANYSCVFWEKNRWNSRGCVHSYDVQTNRHYCSCNHLTSFALIFTPDAILRETFLPTIITSCLSIVGISASIILSVYQQKRSQPQERSLQLSIVKIFSLSSTLILFILVTILLISNYRLDTVYRTDFTSCSPSKRNLVLTVYFFVLLTFIAKTLLGIYYFFTILFEFESLLKDIPTRWFLTSLISVFIIALIPTIVASALANRWNNIILSKNDVCWFDGKYVLKFITIPVSIIIGINVLLLICAGAGLIYGIFYNSGTEAKRKRLITGALMWIASCVSLGILWAIGPLLSVFVNTNGQSTSKASQGIQWVFALLTGLEGVWILIVSVLFYVRRRSKLTEGMYSSTSQKTWSCVDDLGRVRTFPYN